MAPPTLLDYLMAHLIERGLARSPAAAGGAPPFWRQPADGTPAPGSRTGTAADAGVVLAAYSTGGIPPDPGGGYSRRRTVDIDVRAKQRAVLEEWTAALIAELAPPIADPALDGSGIPGLRIDWQMNGLRVIESRLWTEAQELEASAGEGYHQRFTVLFEVYA